MTGFNFSTQAGKSYYFNSIRGFLDDSPDLILGKLTRFAAKYGFDTSYEQTDAWTNQIFELQTKLRTAGCEGDVIFEYDIVRMGKRIDVVLLIRHMVFSLEFKNGATKYLARDAEQAEDYALDLKNFHKESENLYVCPILIATEAGPYPENKVNAYPDGQVCLQYANKDNLIDRVKAVADRYGRDEKIDFEKWFNSPYCPTPTIIEAAMAAYRDHTVANIANSEAGQANIDKCEAAVGKIIEDAKLNHRKALIFVTGVPGAGKTLVGLDMASKNLSIEANTKAVYLSGNGPLVAVLRKALINNAKQRKKVETKKQLTKDENKHIDASVRAFIQEAYTFRADNIRHPNQEPPENVIIFDEAQRCWDKQKLSTWSKKKMGRDLGASEPEYFISIMDRRKDWAVIICLVGLGQDIYDGEVGINEWFEAAINKFPDWQLYYSPVIFDQCEDNKINKNLITSSLAAHQIPSLHLSTSIRSFRSELQSAFVDYLLSNEYAKAKCLYGQMKTRYPVYVTRDIKKAKAYIRSKVRGSQRSGIVACSSAQRLKPDGIFVPTDIDVENYFLAPKEDLRSSNALEVVASEFKVQGLELDYAIVCWDADLRRSASSGWDFYNFKGTKWQKRHNEYQKRYLLNAYRVLLTRARQEMVIFVPLGDDPNVDPTRDHAFYDEIFDFLHNQCGIDELI